LGGGFGVGVRVRVRVRVRVTVRARVTVRVRFRARVRLRLRLRFGLELGLEYTGQKRKGLQLFPPRCRAEGCLDNSGSGHVKVHLDPRLLLPCDLRRSRLRVLKVPVIHTCPDVW
jgi:hypothetical protein